MTPLRPFQAQLRDAIYAGWASGARNLMPVLPTGGGKTVLFGNIIAENTGGSCAIAHRQELTSQISLALARNKVRHRVIGAKALHKEIVQIHMAEVGTDYTNQYAPVSVAGVDTLLNIDPKDPVFHASLVVQDEGHHVLAGNKWGTAMGMFPNARGLFPTATPKRADRKGLGRHADGLTDLLIVGPSMRELIEWGYLTDYRIFAPPCDVDLSGVNISETTGDYNIAQLRNIMHESKSIVGDVVAHYLKLVLNSPRASSASRSRSTSRRRLKSPLSSALRAYRPRL
jgi:DNA repair protein RadD